jgi:Kef-type K+ transport system membrane component KefB
MPTRLPSRAFCTLASPPVIGLVAGQHLPASLVPDSGHRLVTSLFLAICLSVSSVKIVAMVIMEMDFAHAILDEAPCPVLLVSS